MVTPRILMDFKELEEIQKDFNDFITSPYF